MGEIYRRRNTERGRDIEREGKREIYIEGEMDKIIRHNYRYRERKKEREKEREWDIHNE